MKILWLTNGATRRAKNHLGIENVECVGWIDMLCDELVECEKIELCVVFPQHFVNNIIEYHSQSESYYGYYEKASPKLKASRSNIKVFKKILFEEKPDIVHIWGTEYSHALEMMRAFGKPQKTIVSIQGLISVYSKYYYSNLPSWVIYRYTIRDLIRLDNIFLQRIKYYIRGKMEIEVLKSAKYIVGRTDWDQAHTKTINPNADYIHGGELLRKEFYDNADSWNYFTSEKMSIFTSQGWYPIKGLHLLIEAVGKVKKKCPNVKVYVAGSAPYSERKKSKFIQNSYSNYLQALIRKNKLQKNIIFTGNLDADGMVEMLKKSNIFVMPSAIENSPNSLSEAMMIGVPCVVANVGGTKNIVSKDMYEYMYQYDDSIVLANYIEKVFEDCSNGKINTSNEVIKALSNHNVDLVTDEYLGIYKMIYNNDIN